MDKPKFDPQDYFKGTYHKDKSKQNNSVEFVDLYQGLMYNNTGTSGQVYHSIHGWIDKELADKIDYINKPVPLPEIDLCQHDPVDVGFTTPKMVCKKCDKDL